MSQIDFSERLKALFARKPGSEEELKRKNRYAIGMSLLIAVLLWFTVNMRETYTISVNAPVYVRSLPENMALSQPLPETVEVQYQGEGWHLLALRRQPPPLDVHATGETVNFLRVASESGRLPLGVGVLSVTPSSVDLALEPRVAVRVPIRLRGEIRAQAPHALSAPPTLEPDSVTVIGARSLLANLEYWPTAALQRRGVEASFTEVIPLADSLAGLVALSRREVRVTVPIEEFTEGTREVDVRIEDLPGGVRIRLIPDRVRVTFRAPVAGGRFRAAQSSPDFYAFISYDDIRADTTGTVPVGLNIPPELRVRDARYTPRRIGYFTVME